jgi:bacteriocin-like protein
MKKEDLIKKAAERGITLDETQAEKYITLSDEELENISGGGSNLCGFKQEITDGNKALTCKYYSVFDPKRSVQICGNCSHAMIDSETLSSLWCTLEDAWK